MLREMDAVFKKEKERQARINIEDADEKDNGPKEISIFCPERPQVSIVDLSVEAQMNNECLVLHVTAPDISSKLVLKCDGAMDERDGFRMGSNW
eukprot:CAMPEP_0194569506 /NCGR_PEP_ID=MMETSP0292-20121207/7190_1 /TAXON_ID=39354 /ORGANISM="Heterosigma akashiwo, Strain CCMP2393" /LENGTH=93 /DNA_ID=CAMNT_0039419761 /DNA_START=340 /DNA_END=618 /DNA_ORIENTATION=-